MNQDEINDIRETFAAETFANTPDGCARLAACLIHVNGVADEPTVVKLINDNNNRGYLDHCARMGAKVAAVASALAAQLDEHEPIEDEAEPDPDDGPHSGDDPHAGRTEYTEMFFHGLQTFTEAFDDLTRAVCGNINRTDLPPSLAEAVTTASATIARAIENDGNSNTIDAAFISEEGDGRYNITDSIAISGRRIADANERIANAINRHADMASNDASLIHDAIMAHAQAIHKLANVVENAFDRPIQTEQVKSR